MSKAGGYVIFEKDNQFHKVHDESFLKKVERNFIDLVGIAIHLLYIFIFMISMVLFFPIVILKVLKNLTLL